MSNNAPDLHVHSKFSIKDGIGDPEDVVHRAVELGWSAACLSEHGWLGSTPTFYKWCRAKRFSKRYDFKKKPVINPIIGCELYVCPHEFLNREKESRRKHYHLTVLALSAEGYHNLVAWTTFANQRENFYDVPRISFDAMEEIAPYPLHHNVVLSGCLSGELSGSLAASNGSGVHLGVSYAEGLRSLFSNFYLEVQAHRREKFMGKGFENYEDVVKREDRARKKILEISKLTGIPVVLTNDSHMQNSKQRESHMAMIAQKRNYGNRIKIADHLPAYGYLSNYMQSMEGIAERNGIPKSATESANEIVEAADIRLGPLDGFRYSIPFSGYADPIQKIRCRSKARLARVCALHGDEARERFELELSTMGDFAHYLILMSDFIVNAREQGILTNTRGSAANSLVCYCLKIHDIDPMPDAYNLLFSRFVNPVRKKLPDIDIDIEKDRYDDFMRFVIERLTELEGKGQVVPICNYGTYANRSAFRMIADALGVPKEQQDEITKLLPQMIDSGMVDEEDDVYIALKDEFPEFYELTSGVFDAFKNLSQHACGWLFGTRDRPIDKWVPQALIASSGTSVTAYDLKSLDDMGLVKGDFLRLKTLSVIQRTRKMLGQDSLDITDIPLDDEETFQMFRNGKTEGVFTLQGKENRRGVMEIEASSVHDVITSVALYRPALTREGKHTLYNQRRKGIEEVNYAHPILEKILGPTHGVPVFQEQVMEIAYAVGMTDEEVDEIYQAIKLAKGVGKGAKEAFEEIKPKYLKRAVESIGEEYAEEVWNEIRGSQGYGFNKGHATSYGLLAYRAGYLKCHYPAEFYTSLLDVYPERSRYIASARSENFQFLYPSVNESAAGFSLDRRSGKIRVGLSRIKGLGPVAVNEILASQPFHSYDDFRSRTTRRALTKPRVEALAAIGALSCIGVKHDGSDADEFRLLSFTINKPKILEGIKVKHAKKRESDRGWRHLGLDRSVDFTDIRASVTKLFWIPPLPVKERIQLKSSPWAHVKTYLMTAVDENGISFHIMANEDKQGEATILRYLAKKFQDKVVALNGSVRQPFLSDGPLGFRFYGVAGADFDGDPQVFGDISNKDKRALIQLHTMKRRG